jgi:hypothetical protein
VLSDRAELPSGDRQPRDRIGMNARTVDQRELGGLFIESQREIGTPKQDRLGALVPEQRRLTALNTER